MISPAWVRVWNAAAAAFAQERIEVRVALILAAALLVLMVLEGLRASFVPRRASAHRQPRSAVAQPPQTETPARPQAHAPAPVFARAAVAPSQHPTAPPRSVPLPNRKRNSAKPRPHRSMRPKVRRMANAQHGE